MKPHQIIQPVAILSMAIVAGGSISTAFHRPIGGPVEHVLQPLLAVGLWGLLLWKIWKRPHQWGLGVGILLLLMVAFQTFLFRKLMADPFLDKHGDNWGSFLLFGELPILIAGVSCLLLRVYYPRSVQHNESHIEAE